jgi:hypothetical protein
LWPIIILRRTIMNISNLTPSPATLDRASRGSTHAILAVGKVINEMQKEGQDLVNLIDQRAGIGKNLNVTA